MNRSNIEEVLRNSVGLELNAIETPDSVNSHVRSQKEFISFRNEVTFYFSHNKVLYIKDRAFDDLNKSLMLHEISCSLNSNSELLKESNNHISFKGLGFVIQKIVFWSIDIKTLFLEFEEKDFLPKIVQLRFRNKLDFYLVFDDFHPFMTIYYSKNSFDEYINSSEFTYKRFD